MFRTTIIIAIILPDIVIVIVRGINRYNSIQLLFCGA